jgi:hypothetical protein
MRWRQAFQDEVVETLHQLGMRACPVCGSAASLSMSPLPVTLSDARFHPGPDDLAPERAADMTFAVRVECATCGHLMLFNAR